MYRIIRDRAYGKTCSLFMRACGFMQNHPGATVVFACHNPKLMAHNVWGYSSTMETPYSKVPACLEDCRTRYFK